MLLVLKIIVIILLSILGILVLLLLFLLFVPISYKVEGEFHNKIESVEIVGSVVWLLGITKATFQYLYPDITWYARFLWFKITSEDEDISLDKLKSKKKPKKSKQKKTKQDKKKHKTVQVEEAQTDELWIEEEQGRLEALRIEESKEVAKKDAADQGDIEKITSGRKKTRKKHFHHDKSKAKEKKKFNFTKTIRELCDKIKLALEKKEEVMSFFYDKGNQYALNKVKKECLYLWKCSKPHILNIDGELGFQDPATTGQALGYLGMLYGFYGNAIHIIPNFEGQIYDGRFLIKGRTMLFPLVKSIVVLVIDKQVMRTYNRIKEFQF